MHVDTNAHPLHPNISIHILLTVFYTFHLEADKENLFNNQENVELVIISLFSWSWWMIQPYYSKEKLDAGHSEGWRGWTKSQLSNTEQ